MYFVCLCEVGFSLRKKLVVSEKWVGNRIWYDINEEKWTREPNKKGSYPRVPKTTSIIHGKTIPARLLDAERKRAREDPSEFMDMHRHDPRNSSGVQGNHLWK